jgi:hypothetical protein
MVLSAYLRRFDLHQFIETGTHLGDTLAYIAHDKAVKCTSIELADSYYQSAADIDQFVDSKYACGMVWFTKPRERGLINNG